MAGETQVPDYLHTHKRDKNGNIVAVVPYRMHCMGRSDYIEIPKGSGKWHVHNGKINDAVLIEDQTLVKTLQAKFPVVPTPKSMQEIVDEKQAELQAIEAELAAKKAELAAKQDAPAKEFVKTVERPQPAKTVNEAKEQLQKKTASSDFAKSVKANTVN